jgi:hypothetical protein
MKVTVAIPTIADRSMYLASCLRTCVTQDEDFEILVSDNSEGTARDVVASFGDKRIRYVSPPSYLPMSAHWDFVLSQVTGEVFTFIGDDDGLMPGCIKRVREIRSHVGDVPIHHSLCDYRWPDYIFEANRNKVFFFHSAGWGGQMVETSDYLARIARAEADYKDGPMVYHNFVPMQLIRRLTDSKGMFFRRAIPDMYSSLAIAANCPRFYSTEEVLTINGQGARGNGASYVAGRDPKFTTEMRNGFTPRFDSRTIQMLLLDTLIEVSEHFERPDLLEQVKFGAHAARALSQARTFAGTKDEVRRLMGLIRERHAIVSTVACGVSGLAGKFARKLRRARAGPSTAFQRGDIIALDASVQDIYDASRAVADLLTKAHLNVASSKA